MKLYLVERTDNPDYDQTEGFVCAAKSSAAARFFYPHEIDGVEWCRKQERWVYVGSREVALGWIIAWPVHPGSLRVTYLGRAARGTKAGVILEDYNAG